jgi:hypothetical protein
MTDITFDCMGTHARIVCADDATAAQCRAFLERFDAALSRFRDRFRPVGRRLHGRARRPDARPRARGGRL